MERGNGLIVGIAVLALAPVAAWAGGEPLTAAEAFAKLKELEGTWRGAVVTAKTEMDAEAEGKPEEVGPVVHEFRNSANGTVVMETMGPGTPHEMINMYHLDGEDLLLTHYCAGGNQPQMKLDLARSTADSLVFDFLGGTNLDPAKDHHIHAAKVSFVSGGRLESAWTSYADGKDAGLITFALDRGE